MAEQGNAPAAPARDTARARRRDPLSAFFVYVGEVSILLWQTLRFLARGELDLSDLLTQMAQIGVNSVPIALLTALASGAVISLYFTPFLKQYNEAILSGGFVTLAVARELVPVLTGVVVSARAGSQIAAELATMKVTEQIDALRSLAVSPVQYLVLPRILAAVIMVPVVCAIADAVGIFGGFLVAAFVDGVPPGTYPRSIQEFLLPSDFLLGMVKTVVFGLILSLIGCHQGLRTQGGATEVGRATTNAVVVSIVLIYITNFILAYVMFQKPITF